MNNDDMFKRPPLDLIKGPAWTTSDTFSPYEDEPFETINEALQILNMESLDLLDELDDNQVLELINVIIDDGLDEDVIKVVNELRKYFDELLFDKVAAHYIDEDAAKGDYERDRAKEDALTDMLDGENDGC